MQIKHVTDFTSYGGLAHTPQFQLVPGGTIWEKLEDGDCWNTNTGEVHCFEDEHRVIPVEDPQNPPSYKLFGNLEPGSYFCQSPGGNVWQVTPEGRARRLIDGMIVLTPSQTRRCIPVKLTMTVEHDS